jgi:hypothetical protein
MMMMSPTSTVYDAIMSADDITSSDEDDDEFVTSDPEEFIADSSGQLDDDDLTDLVLRSRRVERVLESINRWSSSSSKLIRSDKL